MLELEQHKSRTGASSAWGCCSLVGASKAADRWLKQRPNRVAGQREESGERRRRRSERGGTGVRGRADLHGATGVLTCSSAAQLQHVHVCLSVRVCL